MCAVRFDEVRLNKLFVSATSLEDLNIFPKMLTHTICDPFFVVSYYIKWVTTSWTHSIFIALHSNECTNKICVSGVYIDKYYIYYIDIISAHFEPALLFSRSRIGGS